MVPACMMTLDRSPGRTWRWTGAELGGDEVPKVLFGGAIADVLLHRLEHLLL